MVHGMARTVVSVVVPVHNQAPFLAVLYRAVHQIFQEIPADFELIVVDDGSHDAADAVSQQLHEHDRRVKYVGLSRSFGWGAACAAGVDHALGDAVITMAADFSHPPAVLATLVSQWTLGQKVVQARLREPALTWSRALRGMYLFCLTGGESGETVPFCLLDKQVLTVLQGLRGSGLTWKERIDWLGFRGTPVECDPPAVPPTASSLRVRPHGWWVLYGVWLAVGAYGVGSAMWSWGQMGVYTDTQVLGPLLAFLAATQTYGYFIQSKHAARADLRLPLDYMVEKSLGFA